jgi:hypothetical protein
MTVFHIYIHTVVLLQNYRIKLCSETDITFSTLYCVRHVSKSKFLIKDSILRS